MASRPKTSISREFAQLRDLDETALKTYNYSDALQAVDQALFKAKSDEIS